MTVVDFEQLVVVDLLQLVRRHRPAVIRMIDVRHAASVADGVDVSLHDLDHSCAALRLDPRSRRAR